MHELDKTLEAARKRLQENLDSFDSEVAEQLSTEGERADLWTETDVSVDDLRTVLSALEALSSTSAGVTEEQTPRDELLREALEWIGGNVREGDSDGFSLLGRISAALEASRSPVSQKEAVPVDTDDVRPSVAECVKEYAEVGFWRSCSGCHELNEGVPTGRYSKSFACHLGGGCSECGGIGAIWDTTDYAAMADHALRDELCSDCPPVGYPTDKTRCTPCPRRSSAPTPAGEPAIKALEWTQKAPPGRDHEPFVYWAAGLGGYYSAEPDGLLWMAGDEFTWQQHPTQAAAKAAAQADYETRIRSALHPSPPPVSAPAGDLIKCAEILAGLEENRCRSFPTEQDCEFARATLATLRSPAVEGE